MTKTTMMAPRTTIQLETWTPAIVVFWLNHSIPSSHFQIGSSKAPAEGSGAE
jgi:hypothetical protein